MPDPEPTPTPALRASDADREHTAEILRRAGGEGRLDVDELDERLELALRARTHEELERLVADVVVDGTTARRLPGTPTSRVPVRGGGGGSRWLLSILGGTDRKGRWHLAERAVNVNVMGGSNLDLNDVELGAQHTTLRVVSVMGGSDIHLPEGLNVEVSEFAFMGGNDVHLGASHPDPGGPVLHLHLVSIMGGSDVKRGRPRSRRERREERRRRHLERHHGRHDGPAS